MNRFDKNIRLGGIERLIGIKKGEIEQKKEELARLEDFYKQEHQSDMPILMYQIAHKNYNLINYYQFEYIYYLPEFNEIVSITDINSDKYLDNTLDLKSFFSKVGIPNVINHNEESIMEDYSLQIEYSKKILNNIINEIFKNYPINSWNEVRYYLDELQLLYEVPTCVIEVVTDNPRYLKRK